jgi:hypothetical protein
VERREPPTERETTPGETPPGETPPGETPWADPAGGDEPEPDWAEQIRSARRDRGAKLREVYSRFADEPTPLDDEADSE